VSIEELAEGRQPFGRCDHRQQYGAVAGDPLRPQLGLGTPIPHEFFLLRAQSGMPVLQMPGDLLKDPASAGLIASSRSSTWVVVHARSSARWAACGS
jgi:hypothetical protein